MNMQADWWLGYNAPNIDFNRLKTIFDFHIFNWFCAYTHIFLFRFCFQVFQQFTATIIRHRESNLHNINGICVVQNIIILSVYGVTTNI